jgi:hypothetical protein
MDVVPLGEQIGEPARSLGTFRAVDERREGFLGRPPIERSIDSHHGYVADLDDFAM